MPESKQTTKQKIQKSKRKKKESVKQTPGKKNDFQKQVNDLQDKHLRLKAEFENFRRRKSDEISKLLLFEGETVINNPECIAVSYPNFEIHLKELLSPNKRGLDEPITVIRSLSVEDNKN